MTVHVLSSPGGSKEVTQLEVLGVLNTVLTELGQKLEAGQAVELGAATQAALESIQANVTGTVALDAPSLAALENITASISNLPDDYPDDALLAKVEQVRVLLDAPLEVTGPLTDAELRATELNVSDLLSQEALRRRYGEPGTPKLPASAAYTSPGSHTLITPPSGQRLRIYWVTVIPSSDNANANEIIVKFEGQSDSEAMYRSYVIGHWEMFEGAVDQSLVVVTETGEKVLVTVHYEVFS